MLGTPVIGANLGGLPELIENNITGLLFESGNVDELRRAIEKLSDEALAERMHRNCLNKSFISVEQYYEELIKIYTQ